MISKNEKKLDIFIRDKSNFNDNFEERYVLNFNTRQDFNSAILFNIRDNIIKVNMILKDSGSYETYDFNQKLIRKTTFKSNRLEDNSVIENTQNLKFNVGEKFISFYNKNKINNTSMSHYCAT